MQKELSFAAPTQNTDGSAINEPLSYLAHIDTATPPVVSYSVPAANAVPDSSGIVTVPFTAIGFVPVAGKMYYVDVEAFDASGTSAPSTVMSFTAGGVPNAPTGLMVG